MGGRDHSCEGCGRGGFNDPDGVCICVPEEEAERILTTPGVPEAFEGVQRAITAFFSTEPIPPSIITLWFCRSCGHWCANSYFDRSDPGWRPKCKTKSGCKRPEMVPLHYVFSDPAGVAVQVDAFARVRGPR